MLKIAIDVGRSSVKVVYAGYGSKQNTFTIQSLVGVHPADNADVLVSGCSMLDVASIQFHDAHVSFLADFKQPYNFAVGRYAGMVCGAAALPLGEGDTFHQLASILTLYAVARAVSATREDKVCLAINLTYANQGYSKFYQDALKGMHRVSFVCGESAGHAEPQSVDFEVSQLFCFVQGYASLFNFLSTDKFSSVNSGRGLVVDIGRRTVDLTLVERMVIASGKSIDAGFDGVIQAALTAINAEGVQLTAADVEAAAMDSSLSFGSAHTKTVKPYCFIETQLPAYVQNLHLLINNFAGNAPLSYLLFVGGGACVVSGRLSKLFQVPALSLPDMHFANAFGMLSFLKVGS